MTVNFDIRIHILVGSSVKEGPSMIEPELIIFVKRTKVGLSLLEFKLIVLQSCMKAGLAKLVFELIEVVSKTK